MSDSELQTLQTLKVLSKCQTAFLKAYLHEKLLAGIEVAKKAIDALGKHDKTASATLKKEIAALKLSEIEVDVTSTKLMMSEELAKLRSAVEGGGSESKSSSNGTPTKGALAASSSPNLASSETTAKIKSLEREKKDLKDWLEESKKEVEKLKNDMTKVASAAPTSNPKDKEDLERVTSELNKLKDINKLSGKGAAEKDKTLADQTAEIAKLKKDLASTKEDAEKAKAAADKAVKDAAAEIEAEKQEMMLAMCQEVDDIEKKKAEEMGKLESAGAKSKNLAAHLKKVSADQAAGLQKLQIANKALLTEYKAVKDGARGEMDEMKNQMRSFYSTSLIGGIKNAQKEMIATREKYLKEMTERKRLHNLVQELKGNIRVYMRCRPPTKKEYEQFGNDALCVTFPSDGEVNVFNEKNREKSWEFDETFKPDSKQAHVYEEVSALVTSVLDGYSVCIFAYGQTGSGKTWTMQGPPEDRGVNTRALDDLFSRARGRSSEYTDVIMVSILEVYNETIKDLLSDGESSGQKLEVKMGEHGNHVPGLTAIKVNELNEVIGLMKTSDKNRTTQTTNMNEHSSRSHMMMQVTIMSEHNETGNVTRGKLNLVDLAGSERIDKSGATGQALKEAQNINKSLSALGDVIAARAMKNSHIPFRNSTLTFLLQDSLSQDSKTLMIVCVSPVLFNAEETFCSLNFASRVRTVELGKASKNTTIVSKKSEKK